MYRVTYRGFLFRGWYPGGDGDTLGISPVIETSAEEGGVTGKLSWSPFQNWHHQTSSQALRGIHILRLCLKCSAWYYRSCFYHINDTSLFRTTQSGWHMDREGKEGILNGMKVSECYRWSTYSYIIIKFCHKGLKLRFESESESWRVRGVV